MKVCCVRLEKNVDGVRIMYNVLSLWRCWWQNTFPIWFAKGTPICHPNKVDCYPEQGVYDQGNGRRSIRLVAVELTQEVQQAVPSRACEDRRLMLLVGEEECATAAEMCGAGVLEVAPLVTSSIWWSGWWFGVSGGGDMEGRLQSHFWERNLRSQFAMQQPHVDCRCRAWGVCHQVVQLASL